ncbi:MAG: glycine cleavage system aminomethyltransferase GcvT [Deltaproteobacteria bacterium]|nr:glycine cleavage system aminomethyltransferase GcvT [Deltaproteobacteria bacterium]
MDNPPPVNAPELQRTPLFDAHVRLGGQMVEFAGWHMPVQYQGRGLVAEHLATRSAVGLFDVSHMGEIIVQGPGAEAEVNRLVSNDVSKLGDGDACYALLCHAHGGTVDDLYVYRLEADRFLLVVNASNAAKDFAHMVQNARHPGIFANRSGDFAQIAVQGPNAARLLRRVAPGEAIGLPRNRVRVHAFDGGDLLVATTGYTGESGFEIYCAPDQAERLWFALLDAGADLGVSPVGLGARDTLRLEMGYPLYGNELDDHTNGYEARVGWAMRPKKAGGFIGSDPLLQVLAQGPARKLVGLELTDRGVPRAEYPVLHQGQPVGKVTSGTHSPSLKKPVALAYVPADLSAPGTPLAIDVRGQPKAAVVVPFPFVTPLPSNPLD